MKLAPIYRNADLSTYVEFLNSCIKYETPKIGVHKHHIIPTFMGGKNNKENLVFLSYEDHRKAHMILADCFEKSSKEYTGNIHSALFVQRWIDNKDDDLRSRLAEISRARVRTAETIQKWRESRKKSGYIASEETRLKISKANSGAGNWMYGKTHTDEAKQKISKISSITSKGENNGMYGRKHTEESKKKMSDKLKGTRSGENHNMYGKHHTEETKQKLREKLTNRIISPDTRKKMSDATKGKKRKPHTIERKQKISQAHKSKSPNIKFQQSQSKKIMDNDTKMIFSSKREAMQYYNISRYELGKLINSEKFSIIPKGLI